MKIRFSILCIFAFFIVLSGFNSMAIAERAFTKNSIPDTSGVESYNYWYSKYLNGVKVGYVEEKRFNSTLEGKQVIKTTSDAVTKLKRMNDLIETNDKVEYYETPGGIPLKFIQEAISGEAQSTRIEGIIRNGKIEITSSAYGNVTKSEVIYTGGLLFPYSIDRKYASNPRSSFKYQTVIPDLGGKIVKVDVNYLATEDTDVLGETFFLNKYEIRYDVLPSLFIYEWRDDSGVIYKTNISMMKEAHFLVGEEEAKIIDTRRQVDIMADSMVITDDIIPDPRGLKQSTYILTLKQGSPEGIFVQDKRQKITNKGPDQLNLEVSAYLPDFLLYNHPFTDPLMKAYLKDNNYIQPSHPAIKTKALEIVGNQKNAFLAAKALENWVHKNITEKNFDVGMATSSDTLESKKGDCTEHAVLLAALLRSIGIPSQIIVGLAYVQIPGSDKGSFLFHMWTEAYVGEWIQLDAALPSENVADAARITLSKSTMNNPEEVGTLLTSPVSVIGNLEIKILDFSSKSSGYINITSKATEYTKEFDLSEIISKGLDNINAPIQNINLDKFKDDKGIVDKFNITGLPNVSPVLETDEGYFTKGMAVYARGDIDKSILYFKKSASLIPKENAKKFYDTGVRLAGIMMFSLAKDQFEKAIALDDELWSSKARTYLEEKFPKGVFTPAAEKYNMTGFSFANFANNYPAALLMYEKAIDNSPNFDSALYNLGSMYSYQGEYDNAISKLNVAANINPRNPLIFSALGTVYVQTMDFNKAISNYEKVIQLGSSDDPNFIKEIKFRIAALKAQQMLATNHNNTNAYILVGEAAFENEQYNQAKKAFIKVLSLNKNIASAHLGLGKAYMFLGKPFLAEEELNKAVGTRATSADAYLYLGIINKRRLNFPAAISNIKKALSLSSTNNDYYIELGRTYLDMEDYKDAINVFSKAKNSEGYYWLGVAYLADKQLASAKSNLLKSIGMNPYDARPYKDIGKIYLAEDDLIEARRYLENAIALDTNYADAYYELGLLDEMESDKIGAANNFIVSYSIDPTSVEAYKKAYYIFEEEGRLDKFFLPRPRFVPNKQEREYVIKLLYLLSVYVNEEIKFYDMILNNCKYGLTRVSTDLEGLYVQRKAYTQALGATKGIYSQLLSLTPPPRFAKIHTEFLDALWWQSNSCYKAIYALQLGVFGTNEKAQEINQKVEDTMATASEKFGVFTTDLIQTFNNWDPISLDEVIISSGYEANKIQEVNEKAQSVDERSDEAMEILTKSGYEKVN